MFQQHYINILFNIFLNNRWERCNTLQWLRDCQDRQNSTDDTTDAEECEIHYWEEIIVIKEIN